MSRLAGSGAWGSVSSTSAAAPTSRQLRAAAAVGPSTHHYARKEAWRDESAAAAAAAAAPVRQAQQTAPVPSSSSAAVSWDFGSSSNASTLRSMSAAPVSGYSGDARDSSVSLQSALSMSALTVDPPAADTSSVVHL